MKKHLLGFTVFSFIFASFAIAFAYFYVPKGETCHFQRPVYETNRRNNCQKKSENKKFEVYSTEFDLDKKKLISKIKMNLDGFGKEVKNVSVETKLFTSEQFKVNKIKVEKVILSKFEVVNEITGELVFYVESDLSNTQEINLKENLYAIFDFHVFYVKDSNLKGISETSEAKSVLFVHGKNSVIKK